MIGFLTGLAVGLAVGAFGLIGVLDANDWQGTPAGLMNGLGWLLLALAAAALVALGAAMTKQIRADKEKVRLLRAATAEERDPLL